MILIILLIFPYIITPKKRGVIRGRTSRESLLDCYCDFGTNFGGVMQNFLGVKWVEKERSH